MPKKETQKSLDSWTKEKWGTKSGKPSTQGENATGERYLPEKAREALTDEEYARSTAKKRAAARRGEQFSKQPKNIAKKTSRYRS
jgi:organic radical activating enzyme